MEEEAAARRRGSTKAVKAKCQQIRAKGTGGAKRGNLPGFHTPRSSRGAARGEEEEKGELVKEARWLSARQQRTRRRIG